MTSSKNRKQKKRHKMSFPAFDVFPIHDALGIDLLRLMSLADDMSFVSDWMEGHKHVPSNPYAVKIDDMRASFQHRLWMGFLFELFSILRSMEKLPEFAELHNVMDRDGKEVFGVLCSVKSAKGYSILKRIRNRTFHYDRPRFQKGLNDLKKRFGEDLQDGFIVEIIQKHPLQARTYYNLASTVRNAAIFGVRSSDDIQEEIDHVLQLHEQFYKFLDSAFTAYLKIRNLKPLINWD